MIYKGITNLEKQETNQPEEVVKMLLRTGTKNLISVYINWDKQEINRPEEVIGDPCTTVVQPYAKFSGLFRP